MGEIHELFVLALSLVWFAGANPDVIFLLLLGGVMPSLVTHVFVLVTYPERHDGKTQQTGYMPNSTPF